MTAEYTGPYEQHIRNWDDQLDKCIKRVMRVARNRHSRKAHQPQNKILKEALGRATEAYEILAKKQGELQIQYDALYAQHQDLKQLNQGLETQVAGHEGQTSELETKMLNLTTERDAIQTANTDLVDDMRDVKTAKAGLQQKYDGLEDDYQRLLRDATRIEHERDDLSKANAELSGEAEKLRTGITDYQGTTLARLTRNFSKATAVQGEQLRSTEAELKQREADLKALQEKEAAEEAEFKQILEELEKKREEGGFDHVE